MTVSEKGVRNRGSSHDGKKRRASDGSNWVNRARFGPEALS